MIAWFKKWLYRKHDAKIDALKLDIDKIEAARFRLEADVGRLKGELDKKSALAISFQRSFEDLLNDARLQAYSPSGGVGRRLKTLLRQIEDDRPSMLAYIYGPEGRKTVDVKMRRFHIAASFSLGLGDSTPPELIAESVGEQARSAVLATWQEQSLLNQ